MTTEHARRISYPSTPHIMNRSKVGSNCQPILDIERQLSLLAAFLAMSVIAVTSVGALPGCPNQERLYFGNQLKIQDPRHASFST
jgi:hypothetical protein